MAPQSQTPSPAGPPAPAARRRGSWWPTLIVIAVASGLGGIHLNDPEVLPRLVARLLPAAPAVKAAPPRIVPVTAQRVRQEEMELFLNGLGSVVAFNTVTIRSRVEGELVRVAFSEGQVVKQGDLLAEIDPRPYEVQLTQAEGQLARDQAALQAASLDLARYEALHAQKQITGQQIDSQRALVRQAEAALQIDRGIIDNVKLQLSYCRITAPITGRIGLRLVDPGNIVRGNEPAGLAVIAQLQPIGVVFTIPQDEIGRVQEALAAGGTMAVEAFNRDFHTQLATGTLAALDNQVDASTGTVKIKAVFPNEDGMLFPNQFVNARLLVETLRGALVVPLSAVQRGPDSTFVYVVQPDSTVAVRPVTVGPSQGDSVTITAGLDLDDLVVSDGIDKLSNKAKVAVRGPAATPQGALPTVAGTPAKEDARAAGP